MTMVRYSPKTFSKKEFLTPFDRIFDQLMGDNFPVFQREFGNDFFAQGSYPKCNVVNFDDKVEIEAAIPGLGKDEVDVSIVDGVLTIKAESNQREDVTEAQYVEREVKRSAFARSFTLGENLDETAITAKQENGVLTLTIPKRQETETEPAVRKITIS